MKTAKDKQSQMLIKALETDFIQLTTGSRKASQVAQW